MPLKAAVLPCPMAYHPSLGLILICLQRWIAWVNDSGGRTCTKKKKRKQQPKTTKKRNYTMRNTTRNEHTNKKKLPHQSTWALSLRDQTPKYSPDYHTVIPLWWYSNYVNYFIISHPIPALLTITYNNRYYIRTPTYTPPVSRQKAAVQVSNPLQQRLRHQ